MLAYLALAVCLSIGLYYLVMAGRRPVASRRHLVTAVLLLTTALMLAYANYQSHITHLDLAEISTALDAIHAEDATGRKLTSEELAVRSRRLATLSERLVMLRRK